MLESECESRGATGVVEERLLLRGACIGEVTRWDGMREIGGGGGRGRKPGVWIEGLRGGTRAGEDVTQFVRIVGSTEELGGVVAEFGGGGVVVVVPLEGLSLGVKAVEGVL